MQGQDVACLIVRNSVLPAAKEDAEPFEGKGSFRSLSGVKGGLARKIGAGDVIINPPGTPHWLSEIEGEIEYVEIRVPNVDPAPGVERAEIAPAKAK